MPQKTPQPQWIMEESECISQKDVHRHENTSVDLTYDLSYTSNRILKKQDASMLLNENSIMLVDDGFDISAQNYSLKSSEMIYYDELSCQVATAMSADKISVNVSNINYQVRN